MQLGTDGRSTLPAVVAGLLAVVVVVYGVGGWYRGWYPPAFVAGCAMVGVGLLAAQRTMWVHTGPTEAGAVTNAAMFLLAGATKLGGVLVGVAPLETAAEALFALAVVFFLARADDA
ncbi:hypothetical protein [Candidatus Halobonum tyrrellensis]|uniref:Uncharacterized protein n=1 Tax=Candidatus Halobonum tyrrellensis G22 TaxID=1324957 RepID=V4IYW6_9EURY|nr:hypothetical protein [Candidatus Halobonum tyrrellensis]ESP88302.1 hypothetical protein K933_09272 [Candidatus Halobonum tyrrellensis G22]